MEGPSNVLYWAAVVVALGLGTVIFFESRVGAGVSSIGRALFLGSLLLGGAMAFTHWLCKRNDWR